MKKITLLTITLLIVAALTACASSAAISGTTWKLVSYGPVGNQTPAAANAETTLTFGQDGKFGGNVGCNSLSGDFKVSGSKIVFGPVVSTMMACAEPLMQQEITVTQVFAETASFTLENGKLTVTSQDGSMSVTLEQTGK